MTRVRVDILKQFGMSCQGRVVRGPVVRRPVVRGPVVRGPVVRGPIYVMRVESFLIQLFYQESTSTKALKQLFLMENRQHTFDHQTCPNEAKVLGGKSLITASQKLGLTFQAKVWFLFPGTFQEAASLTVDLLVRTKYFEN